MSSHMGRTYLNSCLKVPIDPCNNCPAPLFNRPKNFLGSLSATPKTPKTAVVQNHCNKTDTGPKWPCSSIRCLAKLYNIIPDYSDLNHLSSEEFYSTLNTLRSTCRELKLKPNCFSSGDRCSTSTTSSSLTMSIGRPEGSQSKKSKKSKKMKKTVESRNHKKCRGWQRSDFMPQFFEIEKQQSFNKTTTTTEAEERKNSFSKSSTKDIAVEVEHFKKSLQEFEAEFKRPLTSLNRSFTRSSSKDFINTVADKTKANDKVHVRSNLSTALGGRLRKSLSFNDLHSLIERPEIVELRKKNKTMELLSFKGESNNLKDPTKLSNYFQESSKSETTEKPKIIIDSSNTEKSFNDRVPEKEKSQQKSIKNEDYKMPFKLFELDSSKKGRSIKSSPSPVHPVARPNLAATLRAESSKRKVRELKDKCTFHETKTQFDWEVRKTPAWKTLSFHETHKEILKLRLATRKAEQALQQREYELNMELMRQRVKSAPLLLEGPTHWGPQVGKLSHACQKEGRKHSCQSNLQRARRRKNSSREHSCRRKMLLSTSSPLEEDDLDNSLNTFRIKKDSKTSMTHKINSLCTIYGGVNSSGTKTTQSRNSDHSSNAQQSLKHQKKKTSTTRNIEENDKKLSRDEVADIDSADELSSLDRAFL